MEYIATETPLWNASVLYQRTEDSSHKHVVYTEDKTHHDVFHILYIQTFSSQMLHELISCYIFRLPSINNRLTSNTHVNIHRALATC